MGIKLELDRVHVIDKVPGTNNFRLTKVQPAMRLCENGEIVWIQRGKLFDDGGQQMDEAPEWFAKVVQKCSVSALAEVGYVKPKGN